jgi:hypothetical protein
MNNKPKDTILYALSDFYQNSKVKTLTIYKGKNGQLQLVAKSRYNKVVYRKNVRLYAIELESQIWWSYNNPLGDEAYATDAEIEAYWERRKKKSKKGGGKTSYTLEEGLREAKKANDILMSL